MTTDSGFKIKAEHWIAAVPAIVSAVAVVIFISGTSMKTDTTMAATVTINARLDRLFDKLDEINKVLPVLAEKVRAAEVAILDGRGGYTSLEVRLRAMENNIAAVHEENVKSKPAVK